MEHKKKEIKGLGDLVEKITESTGIKKAVDTISEITGIPCGCERRKDYLNNLVPFNSSIESPKTKFEDGIYIFKIDIVKNNIIFNKNDKIYITKENKLYNLFKSYYELGILMKDE
jgi:hypothetical protein